MMLDSRMRPELGNYGSIKKLGFRQTMLFRTSSAEFSRSFPVESALKSLSSAALRLRERTTAGKKSWPVLGAKVGAYESQFPHCSGMRRRGVADPFVIIGDYQRRTSVCPLCVKERRLCVYTCNGKP